MAIDITKLVKILNGLTKEEREKMFMMLRDDEFEPERYHHSVIGGVNRYSNDMCEANGIDDMEKIIENGNN